MEAMSARYTDLDEAKTIKDQVSGFVADIPHQRFIGETREDTPADEQEVRAKILLNLLMDGKTPTASKTHKKLLDGLKSKPAPVAAPSE
uniref:Uncharacterized protein n=1 Tax=Chromera velia CCMP2878 TaxID=1169474 RepID=A0A0G4FGZ8_9ALVE|eukprot:Cvel_16884.t1-p1 / transcript=Cvel_16884.t1 / gene=Cvel_16884 / organism=Chromera_velia_CCMP2878 / gene_product=hypothetical protein / transcript_product=hypothetical protein / location=Cvel_scaffold1321:31773-32036(+) / protein_length=88 / sequence_SO=supercontig / SO=protein_coding / is_pseudo=false